MDAQGRGRADNIDPADQWVLNPNTGEYELRLAPSAPQSSVPGPRRTGRSAPGGGGSAVRSRTAAPGRDTELPGQVPAGTEGRILVAGRVGSTRLIDNMPLTFGVDPIADDSAEGPEGNA